MEDNGRGPEDVKIGCQKSRGEFVEWFYHPGDQKEEEEIKEEFEPNLLIDGKLRLRSSSLSYRRGSSKK